MKRYVPLKCRSLMTVSIKMCPTRFWSKRDTSVQRYCYSPYRGKKFHELLRLTGRIPVVRIPVSSASSLVHVTHVKSAHLLRGRMVTGGASRSELIISCALSDEGNDQ
jgi:hypothetical protein